MFNINEEKIDIVYSWVNGNDQDWKAKRDYWASLEDVQTTSTEDCRYIDNDELKYSLRSVEKYAPWINKIYIVTDNQKPLWLNTEHPKIKIIDHKDIIPAEDLPTFNSIAIDHCIANIDGLSELFLYSCDDMFFARYVNPDFFYTKTGKPIFRFRKTYNKNENNQYHTIIKYTDSLIKDRLGFYIARFVHHNIDAYKKSDIINCRNFFKEEIEKSVKSRFRKSNNVERQIYALFSIVKGLGKYKEVRQIDTWLPLYKKIYNKIKGIYQTDSVYIPMYEKNYERVFTRNNPILFCLNDGGDTTDSDRKRAKDFLNKLFPEKSEFEV